MIKRFKKYGSIFRFRKELKLYFLKLLGDERIENILKYNKINFLPKITITNLSDFYSFKNSTKINIKSDFSEGISPVNDYYFLCLIAIMKNAKKYFEIGSWVGLSAYNLSQNLGPVAEIYTLDIPADHPEIAIFNIPPEIFGHYAKNKKNVHFLKSDSTEFDFTPYRRQFDIVFVDGNHSFEYVKNDTKIALELIKDENSVILWHDYKILGEVNNLVLAGILDAIPQNKHKYIYHLEQSNIAIFSKNYDFKPKPETKWGLPEKIFNISIETVKNDE